MPCNTHSSGKPLLNTWYVPDTQLKSRDSKLNKTYGWLLTWIISQRKLHLNWALRNKWEFRREAVVCSRIWSFVVNPVQVDPQVLLAVLSLFLRLTLYIRSPGGFNTAPYLLTVRRWPSPSFSEEGQATIHKILQFLSINHQFLPTPTPSHCLTGKCIHLSKSFFKSLRLGPFIFHLEPVIPFSHGSASSSFALV